jgi:hypothetical protein
VAAQQGAMGMRRKIRNLVLAVLAVPVLIILVRVLYILWIWDGHLETSLNAQHIPTAQYLMQNPEPTPRFLYIDPPPASTIKTGEEIFVATNPFRLSTTIADIAEWTQFFINNSRIGRSNYSWGIAGPLMPPDETYDPEYTFSPPLQPGLHLIEIRVGTSITVLLNPAEARSYMWAYRVE